MMLWSSSKPIRLTPYGLVTLPGFGQASHADEQALGRWRD